MTPLRQLYPMKNIPAALALFALCGTALADPSPEIQHLAHEPASMLDVGLIRLSDSLRTLLEHNLHDLGLKEIPSVISTYDFERNQIAIFVTAAAPAWPAPKETCRQIVKGVQTWMNSSTTWEDGFTHAGYTKNSQEDAAVKAKLPSLILITGAVMSEKPERIVSGSSFCSATLFSGVTFDGLDAK
jgi:hypothetical protein